MPDQHLPVERFKISSAFIRPVSCFAIRLAAYSVSGFFIAQRISINPFTASSDATWLRMPNAFFFAVSRGRSLLNDGSMMVNDGSGAYPAGFIAVICGVSASICGGAFPAGCISCGVLMW